MDTQHAMSCKKGGFITIIHNDLRDLTANLLILLIYGGMGRECSTIYNRLAMKIKTKTEKQKNENYINHLSQIGYELKYLSCY